MVSYEKKVVKLCVLVMLTLRGTLAYWAWTLVYPLWFVLTLFRCCFIVVIILKITWWLTEWGEHTLWSWPRMHHLERLDTANARSSCAVKCVSAWHWCDNFCLQLYYFCIEKMFHELQPWCTSYEANDLTENGLLIMCRVHWAVNRIMTGFQ